MKWFKAITAFCATLLVAVSLAGCAGSSTKESTGGYIDDSADSAKRAVEVTRKVQGVRVVENDLRIK